MKRRRVSVGKNDLATLYPEVAKEWHPTKNAPLTPNDVTNSSGLTFWWQCPKVKGHIYESIVASRTGRGDGCSFCAVKKVSPEKSLATLSPEIAKESHPTKNGKLSPSDVTNKSSRYVWWQCSKVKEHSWRTTVYSRTARGSGCGICKGHQKYSK